MKKIIIIGGVAGGATAATRLRRLSEKTEIIIFERGRYVSFANCGLPYHIGGIIPEREELLLQSPESFKDRYNIDVRIKTECIKINPKEKLVIVRDLKTNKTYQETYDTLLLSPGAETELPPIKGISLFNSHFLRSMEDMDGIISSIKKLKNKSVLVIGGGFIGLEVAENLIHAKVKCHLIEMENQVMKNVDIEIAAHLHGELKEKGVDLILKKYVSSIESSENGHKITLSDESTLEVGLIILGTGVKPRTKLAKGAGLKIGLNGGIEVNAYLQSSDPNIYAVGDAIEVTHLISGHKILAPLAWPSNRQGRIVADNIMNYHPKPFKGALATSIAKVFDLTVASTGLNEKTLKHLNIDYRTAIINRRDHAGYYPGANDIVLKLLFDLHGNILGAQGIGKTGIDKRIDVIATAIKGKLKVHELQELELAYAPPYNSAKDPVNILGYLAENILNQIVHTVECRQVMELVLSKEYELIDVRTEEEYEQGAILNAKNIDVNTLRQNLGQLDKSKKYIVYCRVGFRSYLAYRILVNNGYNVLNLSGGYSLWKVLPEQIAYKHFIGVYIHSDYFNIVIANNHKVIGFKTYLTKTVGVQKLIKDLKLWGCEMSSSLFCFSKNSISSRYVFQPLFDNGAKVWFIPNMDLRNEIEGQNALQIAEYARKNHSNADLFKLSNTVEKRLNALSKNKVKLQNTQSMLNIAKSKADSTYLTDFISNIEEDLSMVDSQINLIWSMIEEESVIENEVCSISN